MVSDKIQQQWDELKEKQAAMPLQDLDRRMAEPALILTEAELWQLRRFLILERGAYPVSAEHYPLLDKLGLHTNGNVLRAKGDPFPSGRIFMDGSLPGLSPCDFGRLIDRTRDGDG